MFESWLRACFLLDMYAMIMLLRRSLMVKQTAIILFVQDRVAQW